MKGMIQPTSTSDLSSKHAPCTQHVHLLAPTHTYTHTHVCVQTSPWGGERGEGGGRQLASSVGAPVRALSPDG